MLKTQICVTRPQCVNVTKVTETVAIMKSVLYEDPYRVLTKEEIMGIGKAEMHFLRRAAWMRVTDHKHDEHYLGNKRITRQ